MSSLSNSSLEESGLTHECAVFGCIAAGDWPTNLDIAQIVYLGLVALQHRGQESAGIVTGEGFSRNNFNVHKGMGLVASIFTEDILHKLKGNLGIGHARYSTSAASEVINCQPFVVHTAHGALAVAHNGEIFNAESLRKKVFSRGVGLSTHSDSELITQCLCLDPTGGEEEDSADWPARIRNVMGMAPLAYSLVIMDKDRIYAVRDPFGNRPLCFGRVVGPDDVTEAWVVSSESCAFPSIGARYVREVAPGEIVELSKTGMTTIDTVARPNNRQPAFCIFEYVYFARPDSIFEGQMVYTARMECGRMLARESFVEADIVSSVPESGTAAAQGFSKEVIIYSKCTGEPKSGIPFGEVLCKNRYVGRTFIQPSARLRRLGVAKKFGALVENVKGKRIILIDDSIVRGNTIGPIIKLLSDAGAKEVHIRIASPPLKYPCYMGINIPTTEELIASRMDNLQLAQHVGAKSLAHLSVDGLKTAIKNRISKSRSVGHCVACLTGDYPVPLDW